MKNPGICLNHIIPTVRLHTWRLDSYRHYLPSGDGEESTTLSRSLFQEKGWLSTKDRIVQVYRTIRELVTPSLVRCILTAQSLCCSLYSHRFVWQHKLPASDLVGGQTSYTYIETQRICSAEIFVRRKSVKCLCTNPPTSVTAVFGSKPRRRHEWLHGSDTVESPLISFQFS